MPATAGPPFDWPLQQWVGKPTALSLFCRGREAAKRECDYERNLNKQVEDYFDSTTRNLPIAGFSMTLDDGTYFDTVGVAHMAVGLSAQG